jgi:signal transduction histidine kinase/methyl-accepting chemotaxis protein
MLRYLRRLITYFNSRIRFKIILPYALLTLVVALTGAYFSTRLVADSLDERFSLQLYDAGSGVVDNLARREQAHISELNAMAFTIGVPEAIRTNAAEKLQSLVLPLMVNNAVNNKIDRVDIVNADGQQLLEIHHPSGSNRVEDYTTSQGADLSDWPIVQKILSGVTDAKGDKFVAVTQIDDKPMVVTAGPVKENGQVVGAVLVSSYVYDLNHLLKAATFSDVSLYNLEGKLLNTTLENAAQATDQLELAPLEVRKLLAETSQSSRQRSISLDGRDYAIIYGVFRARGEPLGFFSVALQRTFITAYGQTARNSMAIIFGLALALVFGIGYFSANAITGRLQHLMENALAVANGDFSRRTDISSDDEIGSLASSLDHMTESLAGYTNALQKRIDELTALYEGSTAVTVKSGLNLEHILHAVTTSVKEVIQGTNHVVVHLLDQSGRLLVPMASNWPDYTQLPNLAFDEDSQLRAWLSNGKPRATRLAELSAHSFNGSFNQTGFMEVLIAPLVAGQEAIGMLTLTPDETYPRNELLDDDKERLLGTMANQVAIAIKNAQLFEATQQAYEELKKLDDLKTQFINIAAHELRTPLGAMMGYASYAEKRAPEKLKKSMRFMVASTVRMRTMVDAMLTIQRLDAGTAFLRLTTVDIAEIVNKVIADFEAMAELEGHTLQVDLPEQLPLVEADPEKINLILSNLVSNAIKFTSEGGHIVVTAQDYLKGVLVSVQDNGGGIAPEDHERIFDRFYQVRAEHLAGHGGIGLGLTIVKHLVELHEGRVWLESELGKGTTFYFTIPQETPVTTKIVARSSSGDTLFKKVEALLLETS